MFLKVVREFVVDLIVRDSCIHILDTVGFFKGEFVVFLISVKDSRFCIIRIKLVHDGGFANLYGMM